MLTQIYQGASPYMFNCILQIYKINFGYTQVLFMGSVPRINRLLATVSRAIIASHKRRRPSFWITQATLRVQQCTWSRQLWLKKSVNILSFTQSMSRKKKQQKTTNRKPLIYYLRRSQVFNGLISPLKKKCAFFLYKLISTDMIN